MTVEMLTEQLKHANPETIVEVFAEGNVYNIEDVSFIPGRSSGDPGGLSVRDEDAYSLDCGWASGWISLNR